MADNIAPTPPRNLTVSPNRQGPALHWDQAMDNVAVDRYEVLRDGDVIGRVEPPESNFIDKEAPAGSHSYYIYAYDSSGNRSTASNTVAITVENLREIFAPQNLNAAVEPGVGGLQVRLTWNRPANDTQTVGFQVNRNNTKIVRTRRLIYIDNNNIQLNQVYTYFIRSYDLDDNLSDPSNSVRVEIKTIVQQV